jgi:hypothetical protein
MPFVHLPTFLHAVACASNCTTNESVPALLGVLVQATAETVTVAATDGKAIAEWSLQVFPDAETVLNCLSLPLGTFILSPEAFKNWAKTAKEHAKMKLNDALGCAIASISGDGQVFALTYASGAVEVSRLIAGQFPPYVPAFLARRTWASFGDSEWASLGFNAAKMTDALKGIDANKEICEHVLQGRQRGCLLYPIAERDFVVCRRALCMTVSLPEDYYPEVPKPDETVDISNVPQTSDTADQEETIAKLRETIARQIAHRVHDDQLIAEKQAKIEALEKEIANSPRIGEANTFKETIAQLESEKARLGRTIDQLKEDMETIKDRLTREKEEAENERDEAQDSADANKSVAWALEILVAIPPNTVCHCCGRDRLDGHAHDCRVLNAI